MPRRIASHCKKTTSSDRPSRGCEIPILALDVLPLLEREAKKRQLVGLKRGSEKPVSEEIRERHGKATDRAASLFNTNPRYVEHLKKLEIEASASTPPPPLAPA